MGTVPTESEFRALIFNDKWEGSVESPNFLAEYEQAQDKKIDKLKEDADKYLASVSEAITKSCTLAKATDVGLSSCVNDGKDFANNAMAKDNVNPLGVRLAMSEVYDMTQGISRLSRIGEMCRNDYYRLAEESKDARLNRIRNLQTYVDASIESARTAIKLSNEKSQTIC